MHTSSSSSSSLPSPVKCSCRTCFRPVPAHMSNMSNMGNMGNYCSMTCNDGQCGHRSMLSTQMAIPKSRL